MPKEPQDHQQKAKPVDEYFSFTHDGTEYTMPHKTLDKITMGFIRQNRRRDEVDYVLTAVEVLADGDEEILSAVDSMDSKQANKFIESFGKHLGASQGE